MTTHLDIIDFIKKKLVKPAALEVFSHFNEPSNSIKTRFEDGFL